MTVAGQMLDSSPKDTGGVDQATLVACIEACVDCAQACTGCADACLSEQMVAELTDCIRTDLDCADICAATARVLTRHTASTAAMSVAAVRACATACGVCAQDCEAHAGMHEHCRICAEACRRCEQACNDLLTALT